MNYLLFKKQIRRLAAICGILRPLKYLIIRLRGGGRQHQKNLEWYSRFIKPGQLVFDVGANRGQSSELFIQLGAHVVAFEPQKDLHHEIRQLCRNSPNLTVEDCGLGDREEIRRFFMTAYDQVASLRKDWEGIRIGEKNIQVSTLDHQIAIHGMPNYCKIDVEGWELEVLKGLSKPISVMSFEYHQSPEEIEKAKEVLERINKLGVYFCNLKQARDDDFLLSEFVPMETFAQLFPTELDPPVSGYGDIYCTLKD